MKNSSLYICDTLYHLYIFLVTCDKSKKNNLILTDFTSSLAGYRDKLLELPYVNKVFFVNSLTFQRVFVNSGTISKIIRGLFYPKVLTKQLISSFPFLEDCLLEEEVFIFVDVSHLARFFLINHSNVVLLDDGEGNYFPLKKGIIYFLKHYILSFPEGRGVSDSIVKVCLRKPEKVDSNLRMKIGHKLEKLDLSLFEQSLNESEIENILKVFELNLVIESDNNNSVLIFTQPFSEDDFISEEYKLDIYINIVNHYIGYNVFIKPHPRELTNYDDVFGEKVTIIDKNIPSECFNLDVKCNFDIGVAIQSTALDNALFVETKISLGYESFPKLKLGKEKKDAIKIG